MPRDMASTPLSLPAEQPGRRRPGGLRAVQPQLAERELLDRAELGPRRLWHIDRRSRPRPSRPPVLPGSLSRRLCHRPQRQSLCSPSSGSGRSRSLPGHSGSQNRTAVKAALLGMDPPLHHHHARRHRLHPHRYDIKGRRTDRRGDGYRSVRWGSFFHCACRPSGTAAWSRCSRSSTLAFASAMQ